MKKKILKIHTLAASVRILFFWNWTLCAPGWKSGSESTVIPHDHFSTVIAIVSNVTMWSKGNSLIVDQQPIHLPLLRSWTK